MFPTRWKKEEKNQTNQAMYVKMSTNYSTMSNSNVVNVGIWVYVGGTHGLTQK